MLESFMCVVLATMSARAEHSRQMYGLCPTPAASIPSIFVSITLYTDFFIFPFLCVPVRFSEHHRVKSHEKFKHFVYYEQF